MTKVRAGSCLPAVANRSSSVRVQQARAAIMAEMMQAG